MKSLEETSIQLTSALRGLNQEIRLRLSSMHSCTERETLNLAQWQEEAQKMAECLENDLCVISQHLHLLKDELHKRQHAVGSMD